MRHLNFVVKVFVNIEITIIKRRHFTNVSTEVVQSIALKSFTVIIVISRLSNDFTLHQVTEEIKVLAKKVTLTLK